MKQKPLISIIVPVYNVENYIKKCVDSIKNQSYSNLEIILVDDGSTDTSGEICDELAINDNRIIVIHKKNGGQSDARNSGLKIMKGEYIGFVDSDDYIDSNMYEHMLRYMLDNQLDVVMCGTSSVFGEKEVASKKFDSYILTDKEDIIEDVFAKSYEGSTTIVCNKLFKRKIFSKLYFKLNTTFEDDEIALSWINRVSRYGRISNSFYKYVQRDGSTTHRKKYKSSIFDVISIYEKNRSIIYRDYIKASESVNYRYWWAHRCALDMLLGCVDYREHINDAYQIQSRIKKNIISIIKNKYNSKKQLFAYTLIALNLSIYKKVKDIHDKKVACNNHRGVL
jgi:glycosyltransferase involved in cell wall biosynthesis